ncbi:hypothetical protein BN3660_01048 [Eubacteriaceae bacterium CHKCI004]|nr:hypothetical protein BN3660_01048 [Eubacteriaceae bacterium CHKCI004]
MGIKKSKESTFHVINSGFRASRNGIRRAGKYVDSSGEIDEDQDQRADPIQFLPRKLQKKWMKLPEVKKQFYKEQARRTIQRKTRKKGVAFSQEQPGIASPETVQEAAKLFIKEEAYGTHGWRRPKDKKIIGIDGIPGQAAKKKARVAALATATKKADDKNPEEEIAAKTEQGGQAAFRQSGLSVIETPTRMSGMAGKKAATTASVPLQAGMTVTVAKKAAGMFAERVKMQNSALENQRIRLQSKIDHVKESHQQMGTPSDAVAYVTAVAATGLLAVALMAFQLFAAIFSAFLVILLPVLVIALIISTIVSVLTSIFGAVDPIYAFSTGESIVVVAMGEIGYHEGAGNETKYGEYTGTNGMSWCHAFVSWCANECGFVDMGIFPKTASCEIGRQWFIGHQQYQASDGTYEPKPGDIIYFDYGQEGVSHHVGIVEYTENGVVHTIEGNKNDQVMRAHYNLNYVGIMGYGKPAYPDTGVENYGTASEFLSECKRIVDTIVGDGDWVYSNWRLQDNFEDARKKARKTNCAMYVAWCMQEFGTLKKGQYFYSNWDGKLTCSSTVREQLEKYYDIYQVGNDFSEKDLNPGDICLWKGHTNVYAGKDSQGKRLWYDLGHNQTSDNKAESGPFVRGVRVGNMGWTELTAVLRLKDQDSYGSGKTITLPKGLGDVYSYMGWEMITSRGTRQYELRIQSGEPYDRNGFGVIDGRYVVACTSTFGEIGDEVDFVLGNGKVIHAIIGEYKSFDDPDCNTWGHEYGHCVVEFCVNKSSWYGYGKSITRYHPEWADTTVVKAVNLQKNFFDD